MRSFLNYEIRKVQLLLKNIQFLLPPFLQTLLLSHEITLQQSKLKITSQTEFISKMFTVDIIFKCGPGTPKGCTPLVQSTVLWIFCIVNTVVQTPVIRPWNFFIDECINSHILSSKIFFFPAFENFKAFFSFLHLNIIKQNLVRKLETVITLERHNR